ncbi:MAG: shikimate dehydrogenase, partial [Flavobacteriales bacterium]|nr:shikimate dehydrogenase [Flavobacteriales bacterium]MDW8431506.1 shikimate dehydrogenase [Flavobacteriales bacterium]
MLELGLAGNPILHSLSPAIFERFFRRARIEGRYDLFQLQSAQEIQSLFDTRKNLKGLNVTIPFKRSVVPLLDRLDATALKCGSVNVIKKLSDGQLAGYNTDIAGFTGALQPFISALRGPVLVLGGGGA